jgi:hypothetical protein
LRGAAGDLPLDQHRVDRSPDVVADKEALDRDRTTVALDAHLGEMHAVGVGHVFGGERGVSGKFAAGAARDCGQVERGSAGRIANYHPITGDGQTVGRGLQQSPGHCQQFAAHLRRGDRHSRAGHHRDPRGEGGSGCGMSGSQSQQSWRPIPIWPKMAPS